MVSNTNTQDLLFFGFVLFVVGTLVATVYLCLRSMSQDSLEDSIESDDIVNKWAPILIKQNSDPNRSVDLDDVERVMYASMIPCNPSYRESIIRTVQDNRPLLEMIVSVKDKEAISRMKRNLYLYCENIQAGVANMGGTRYKPSKYRSSFLLSNLIECLV